MKKKSTKELIESEQSSEDVVKSLTEARAKGERVFALEGDSVRLQDGSEVQLYAYRDGTGREPIALSIGVENVTVGSRPGNEYDVHVSKITHVMASSQGDRNFRQVEYINFASKLIYKE